MFLNSLMEWARALLGLDCSSLVDFADSFGWGLSSLYYARMKISVITDISVLRFYRYIRNIREISVERRLFKIYRNDWKNSKK